MKRVFRTIYEVCQKWAENEQDTGRAGNVHFTRDTIFSYSWYGLAQIHKEVNLVLCKAGRYSPSTSRHLSATIDAARRQSYEVLRVESIEGNHDVNLAYYLANMKETVMAFDRTRRYGRGILSQNNEFYTDLLRYCELFRLKVPMTLGLYLDKNYPFIARRFLEVPGDPTRELFLPKWLAEKGMDNVESEDMLKARNAEVRREIIRRLGIERICADLEAKTIDRQDGYKLILLDLRDGRRRPFLKMQNPSVPGIWHLEGIHPSLKTVQDALNYRRHGDDMFVVPDGWREKQEWRRTPENWEIKPEFVTSPMFSGENNWTPEKLT